MHAGSKAVWPALATLLFVLLDAASGASVAMDVQPRVLALGERATLTITVEGLSGAPEPVLPSLPGFQVQSTGRQQSFAFGTGGQRASIIYTYALAPTSAGTFDIGPIVYEADNQRFELPAVRVEVRPAGSSGAQELSDMLFARLTADRPAVYNQEQFNLTISIYSRGVNIDQRNITLANMPTTGLSVEEFREMPGGREVVDNAIYEVRRFTARTTALTAGTFEFAPSLRVNILTQRRRNQDPFFGNFDDFFFGRMESQPYDLNCPPLAIEVKPLPNEGRPASFSGAVGRFDFDVQVKPTEVNAGDPVTVTTFVTGRGNLSSISPPPLDPGNAFKAYEAKQANREFDADRNLGRLTFEQVLIPKTKDIRELPQIEFSYFDPERGAYETLRKGPFPLVVHPGSNTAAAALVQLASPAPSAETKMLGVDILYLKSAPSRWLRTGQLEFFRSPVFLGAQAVPVLALAALFFAVRKRRELERDVSKARRLQAPRAARAALARAETAAKASDAGPFYEALWAALADYFGNRLNLPPGDVSRDVILSRLRQGGLDDASAAQLNALIDACEQARYGAAASMLDAGRATDLLKQAAQLLRTCERIKL